jgi:hypothetical protein
LCPFEQLFLEALLNVQGLQARAYISSLDPQERQELQRDFNEAHTDPNSRPCVEVLIASYFTNGVGLNLHHDCSSCHLFDQPPSQAARQQAIGRTYRLGQKRPVEVVEYNLAKSFDLYQLSRVTRRAMPAAMSFLDLDKLGVPDVGSEEGDTDSKVLARQLSGWWKLRDGRVVHETGEEFADSKAAGELDEQVGSPEDLLRHLINLSRGTRLMAYERAGEALPNPFLADSFADRITRLRHEIEGGDLGRLENIRKAQLRDLEVRQAASFPSEDPSPSVTSTPKRKREQGAAGSTPKGASCKKKTASGGAHQGEPSFP